MYRFAKAIHAHLSFGRESRAPDNHVPDEVYEQTRKQFNQQELADLTLAGVAINGWNRIVISFRQEPRTYQPASRR